MTLFELKRTILADHFRLGRGSAFRTVLKHLLIHPGFKICFWFRVCSFFASRGPMGPVTIVARVILRHYTLKYGVSIPPQTHIGPGLFIAHIGGITLNARVRIGKNCNLSQNVTIGESNRGERKGVPLIGDNVYIGPGAVIIGNIEVGDHAAIGANCVVTKGVPANGVVGGVPGKLLSMKSSAGYISNTDWDTIDFEANDRPA